MRASAIASAIYVLGLNMLAAFAAAPGTAPAQDLTAAADAADAAAAPESMPLSAQESAALSDALASDPATLANARPAKPLRLPGQSNRPGLAVSRTDKPDGSSTVIVKQPLASEWDAHVGADLGLGPGAPESYRPGQPLPVVRDGRGSGAAWATVGVLPNLATLDARIDPANDQGKLGTTFKHSIPLGGKFSVTLQNSYTVTETYGTPPAAPGDLPLMVAAPAAATPTPQVWGNEKLAKLAILSTGTTLAAALASSSTDPVTHNTLSAEQKLYGPLQVTTAVTDVGQPTVSKSITAGFKLHW